MHTTILTPAHEYTCTQNCMHTFPFHHLFNSVSYLAEKIFNISIIMTMWTFSQMIQVYFSFLAHFDVTEVNTCLLSLLFSMCPPLFVIKFSQFNLHRTVKRIRKPIRSSLGASLTPEMLVPTALRVSLRGPLGGPWVLCVQANFPDPTSSSFSADALLGEVLPPAAPWREAHRRRIPWRNGIPEMCTWLSHNWKSGGFRAPCWKSFLNCEGNWANSLSESTLPLQR